jgi:hypothetical protein
LALGAAFGYWAPWYYPYYGAAYPYPYASYPAVAYSAPGAVYADAGPTTYIQQDPGYRYYCRSPAGFYPDVPNCSTGWLKVLPDASAQPIVPGQTQ